MGRTEPIGLALLGIGRWGTHLLRNFLAHPQARVMAVVDPHPDRLAVALERFSLQGQIGAYTDLAEALALPGLEAVVVATPAATHYPLIKAALEWGLHVLAEKPLTLDPQQGLELCHLADRQQRQLVIDHTYLFHPAVQAGQGLVRKGDLGRVRYGYAARTHLGPVRQDADALWDLAIHDIAIYNHWLGELPCQVQARGMVWLQPQQQTPLSPKGLADLVWVTLSYPSGFEATIHLCWANPDKQRRLVVVGDQGSLIFDELATQPLVVERGTFNRAGEAFVPIDQSRQPISLPTAEPLRQVCDHFLACVAENRPSSVSSGWLGVKLVQILTALSLSLTQGGQPIVLDYGSSH